MNTVTTPRTSRKPRSKPERHVTIGNPTNGVYAVHMTIGTGEKAQHYGYYVQPIPADFGMGFHFEKFGTEREGDEPAEYDVLIDTKHGHHTCECKGFQRWNHCKHLESLLALVQSGKLPVPAPAAKPVQPERTITGALVGELLAMRTGEVRHVHGHRVERFASAILIDDCPAMSPRQVAQCLAQSEPCQRPAPIAATEFEDL